MTDAGGHPAVAVLTLNPTVDVSYEVERLIPDQKAHATLTRYDPGGNGVNVGRALKTLSVHARTVITVGGELGEFLRRMLGEALDDPHYISVPGESTRVSCTILESERSCQYEVTGVGPGLSGDLLQQIENRFLALGAGGVGVLTGSLPPGVPEGTYGELAGRMRDDGGRAIVDAHDEVLRQAVARRPFMIKPNRHELEQLCGRSLTSVDAVAKEARRLQGDGIAYVCVSLGAEGALLAADEGVWHARAPEVAVRSTVGAGDSMVAGLAAAVCRGDGPEAMAALGVACGTGTATKPGTALFDAGDIEEFLPRITVDRL